MHIHVCPWWMGPLLASPVRRLLQDPGHIVGPYVKEGMTVLEPGPGMGFFTLEMARRVGEKGRVVAVDLQQKMLDGLSKRAARKGLLDRIELRLGSADTLGVTDLGGRVDMALAFAMVHELEDPARFFLELRQALKPKGTVLFAEPGGHVSQAAFEASLALAERAGFMAGPGPKISRSRTALLR